MTQLTQDQIYEHIERASRLHDEVIRDKIEIFEKEKEINLIKNILMYQTTGKDRIYIQNIKSGL